VTRFSLLVLVDRKKIGWKLITTSDEDRATSHFFALVNRKTM